MNKSLMKQCFIASLVLAATAAHADFLGLEIGGTGWQQDFTGDIQSGTDQINVNDMLGVDDNSGNSFYISFEHPLPVLPNIAIARTEMDVEASSAIPNSFSYDGVSFPEGSTVNTDADLTHTDVTFYYEVLDNWVSLDLGLTARRFNGGIDLSSTITQGAASVNRQASEEFGYTLPLLYLAAKFDLPLTGLYVGGDVRGLSYEGDSLIDYNVNIGYESSSGLGVEVGLRAMELQYEDQADETADLNVDGGYATIFYHF